MGSNPAVLKVNPLLEDAARRRSAGSMVCDLSDTSFHSNGIRYPDRRLAAHFADYIETRSYTPESLGRQQTRVAVAELIGRGGLPVSAEGICLTASTSESYALIFQSLFPAGARILLPSPTYPLFEQLCEYARLTPVYYRLNPEAGFAPDFREIERVLSQQPSRGGAGGDVRNGVVSAVVVISPNNPTGAVLTEAQERRMLALCGEAGVPLIEDEVFRGFEWETRCHRQDVRNGAVLRFKLGGASKRFASPDLKLAWIACCGAGANEAMERLELASDTYLNASAASQFAVGRMLEEGDGAVRPIVNELRRRKELADSLLSDIGRARTFPQAGGIHRVLRLDPLAGLLNEAGYTDDEASARALLRTQGVLVHPGYFYGFPDEGYWVLSTLAEPERLKRGIEGIRRFLDRAGTPAPAG